MTDHPMGRRAYDDDQLLMLGRVEERTVRILQEIVDLRVSMVVAEARLVERIAKVEARVDVLDELHAEERGATRERSRWVALAKMVKDATPAGVLLAVYSVVLHYLSSGGAK